MARNLTDDSGEDRRPRWRLRWPDWPVTLLVAVMVLIFIAMLVDEIFLGGPDWALIGGVSALALRQGRWWTLLSNIFLHGGILHIWFNMAALISLGAPISQRFGRGLKAVGLFYGFFLVCGILGGLTFVLIDWNGAIPAIGASGAIFGLWGAVARMGGGYAAKPLPFLHPFMRTQAVNAVISNLVVIGLLMLTGALSGGQMVWLAWQAHLGGYLAGLLLIGPFLRWADRA
jgi:membrane associated rhomboid family serine protease